MNETVLQDLRTRLFDKEHLTTKSVAIEHSISRSVAASLLESLPYVDTSKEQSYEITRCVYDKKGDKFVAKLQTDIQTIKPGDIQTQNEHQIHSISLHTPFGSTSILATHLKTLTLTHDHKDTILDPEMGCDVIDPAESVQRIDIEFLRKKRVQDNSNDSDPPKAASTVSKIKKAPTSAPVKKAASAAAFFGSSNGTSSKTKAKVAKEKENTANADMSITSKSVTSKETSDSKKEIPKPDTTVKKTPKKGNADDFVGDEDEDEEFLEKEEERKKRVAASDLKATKERQRQEKTAATRERRQQPKGDQETSEMDVDRKEDDEDDHEPKVHGAMDAFAVKTKKVAVPDQNNDQTGRKRRKQVLEERTFVDEKGFFRTETITVWKDVEETEVEKNSSGAQSSQKSVPQKSAATKPKDTKQMKQQGLMGFFNKK